MKMKAKIALTCLLLTAATLGCKEEKKEEGKAGGAIQDDDLGGNGTVASCTTYEADIVPIYQKACVSCHTPGAEAAQWDLSTYEGSAQWADRSVVRAVTQGDMPPLTAGITLSEAEKATIQNWVSGGKINTTAECTPSGETTAGATAGATTAGATTASSTTAGSGDLGDAFGSAEDVEFATELWLAMRRSNLVGDGAAKGFPKNGTNPHGAVVTVSFGEVSVLGQTEKVFIKHNYTGKTVDQIIASPETAPAAITVIFQREQSYDTEVDDKFFVQYLADGSIDESDQDIPLAGVIGKGKDDGCAGCHAKAKDDDFIYGND